MPGPDPHFPVLGLEERIQFPDAREVPGDEPALWGANLSPGVLLSAYEQGFFPWYAEDEPLWWWSPDPRFVLFPDRIHRSRSMDRILQRGDFSITADTAFRRVMESCAAAYRPGQAGTWITDDMIRAYCTLHQAGIAHSIETWQAGELVGGFYGVMNGRIFCGESMFSRTSNASKAAFLTFAALLPDMGIELVDSQVHTQHLESMGAEHILRNDYLSILVRGHRDPLPRGHWTALF